MDALYEQLGIPALLGRAKALFATDDEEAQAEVGAVFSQIDEMLTNLRGWYKTNTHQLMVDLTLHAYFRIGDVETMEVQYGCQAVAALFDALRFLVPNASPKLVEQARERLTQAEDFIRDGEDELKARAGMEAKLDVASNVTAPEASV